MREYNFRLTEEQYKTLISAEDYGTRSAILQSYLPDWILCGYGYYGMIRIYEKDGGYFATIRIGTSCD